MVAIFKHAVHVFEQFPSFNEKSTHTTVQKKNRLQITGDLLTSDNMFLLCLGMINHHLSNNYGIFHLLCSALTDLQALWETVCVFLVWKRETDK